MLPWEYGKDTHDLHLKGIVARPHHGGQFVDDDSDTEEVEVVQGVEESAAGAQRAPESAEDTGEEEAEDEEDAEQCVDAGQAALRLVKKAKVPNRTAAKQAAMRAKANAEGKEKKAPLPKSAKPDAHARRLKPKGAKAARLQRKQEQKAKKAAQRAAWEKLSPENQQNTRKMDAFLDKLKAEDVEKFERYQTMARAMSSSVYGAFVDSASAATDSDDAQPKLKADRKLQNKYDQFRPVDFKESASAWLDISSTARLYGPYSPVASVEENFTGFAPVADAKSKYVAGEETARSLDGFVLAFLSGKERPKSEKHPEIKLRDEYRFAALSFAAAKGDFFMTSNEAYYAFAAAKRRSTSRDWKRKFQSPRSFFISHPFARSRKPMSATGHALPAGWQQHYTGHLSQRHTLPLPPVLDDDQTYHSNVFSADVLNDDDKFKSRVIALTGTADGKATWATPERYSDVAAVDRSRAPFYYDPRADNDRWSQLVPSKDRSVHSPTLLDEEAAEEAGREISFVAGEQGKKSSTSSSK